MNNKWDLIVVILIGITIFEFWRNLRDDKRKDDNEIQVQHPLKSKRSWRDFFSFLGEPVSVIFLFFFVPIMLLQNVAEARILLVWGLALYCGIRYFRSGLKEKPQKNMNFFEKMVEFICLVLLSLMVGFAIFMIAIPDMERYGRKQMIKEIQQQQTQKTRPVTNQYQR